MITRETIIEFMGAIKEEYGNDVSFSDASIMLSDLVGYFDTLANINSRIETSSDILKPYE